MPAGTPPEAVREATAEAARELFEGHKYVFVLHEDQGAPHVHLSVRADRYDGVRLAPRKADLDRWRAVFARGLQDRGVNAVATRQPVRAANRNYRKLWESATPRPTDKRKGPCGTRRSHQGLGADRASAGQLEGPGRCPPRGRRRSVSHGSGAGRAASGTGSCTAGPAARGRTCGAHRQCAEGTAGSLKVAATLRKGTLDVVGQHYHCRR
jgi:hypothetical protein